MSEDPRERERSLREELDANADDAIIEGSGQLVTPRRLGHMVSLRLEPELAARLRELASQRGVSVSELIREGAALLVARAEQPGPSYEYEVHGAQSVPVHTIGPASAAR